MPSRGARNCRGTRAASRRKGPPLKPRCQAEALAWPAPKITRPAGQRPLEQAERAIPSVEKRQTARPHGYKPPRAGPTATSNGSGPPPAPEAPRSTVSVCLPVRGSTALPPVGKRLAILRGVTAPQHTRTPPGARIGRACHTPGPCLGNAVLARVYESVQTPLFGLVISGAGHAGEPARRPDAKAPP